MFVPIVFYFICGIIIFYAMFFYGIQQLYLRKHFACFYIIKVLCIYKFTPCMRPAIERNNIFHTIKLIVGCISICLKIALIIFQCFLWPLCGTACLVFKQYLPALGVVIYPV